MQVEREISKKVTGLGASLAQVAFLQRQPFMRRLLESMNDELLRVHQVSETSPGADAGHIAVRCRSPSSCF